MRRRKTPTIRQIDVDFLCLSIFGQRALPDEMAERIAVRRDLAHAIDDQATWDAMGDRQRGRPRRRLAVQAERLEAVAV